MTEKFIHITFNEGPTENTEVGTIPFVLKLHGKNTSVQEELGAIIGIIERIMDRGHHTFDEVLLWLKLNESSVKYNFSPKNESK